MVTPTSRRPQTPEVSIWISRRSETYHRHVTALDQAVVPQVLLPETRITRLPGTKYSAWSWVLQSRRRSDERLSPWRWSPAAIRWEVFNLTNHPSYGLPNAELGSPDFGTIRSTVSTPRQMQFGVKFLF